MIYILLWMGMDANDFIPIRVSTLRGDLQIPFDAYVRVAGKFILYCRHGDSFEGVRIQRLKEKKIKQLFITHVHEESYRGYLRMNIDIAYNSSNLRPMEVRAQVAQGMQQAATEEVLDAPASKEQYDNLKEGTVKYVEFILNENEALRNVLAIENSNSSIAHHGVNVATLATGLAHHLGIRDNAQLTLLAVGCLLHDLEHFYTELNVARPISAMTPAEVEIYNRHCDDGVARVQQTQFYDQMVLKIIQQHHEYINGTGHPRGLRESDMEPLVMMAAVANAYERLISFEGVSPKEATKKLMIDKVGLYKLEYIKALSNLLKDRGFI